MHSERHNLSEQEQPQRETTRDLDQERKAYERMIERLSEASRVYTSGKFRSA